ncbi:MAG: diguanylate cyclase [Acidimicrobiales bacterium]|nr:diguanylate cyclase [Acidimicrobiales bacterium]
MTKQRIDLVTGLAACSIVAGLVAALGSRRTLGIFAACTAAASAVLSQRNSKTSDELDSQVTAMTEQIHQLERAVASQVQNRMAAEDAVKLLSEQLFAAEQSTGTTGSKPIMIDTSGERGLTDPETGLFNHEYFLVALDSRIAAARRHLRPVAVALLKVVDGRDGKDRPAADPTIAADALRKALRDCDTATRLDDGRFGVVLEDTPENGAIWTLERVRRLITEDHPNLTFWAGVACYPTHAVDTGSLVNSADNALTAAYDWPQDRIEVAVE